MDINTARANVRQAQREERTIMLESQTPAYARDPSGRRANDLIWKRANNLRRALANGGIPMKVVVRTIVPHKHQYVSGLNVPTNYHITCGKDQENAFNRTQSKAKKGLEARNV
jgi:hypothetical protein